MYDPTLGYDPQDPTSSAAGRASLAGQGANTLSNPGQLTPQQIMAVFGAMGYDPQQIQRGVGEQTQFTNNITQGQLGVQQGQLGVNRNAQQATQQYQQGLLQQALAQLQQNAQQFGQTFGLQQAGVTGTYNGAPTFAALTQAQQNALAQAGLMGYDAQGNPTLAGQGQQQQFGLQQAGLMGTYNGQETLAGQAQRAAQEQQRAQLGLQTLQLGSQLSGPSNWLQYENAAAGARANPLLQQGVASWADMTNNRPTGTGGWASGYQPQVRSLGTMATDFGGGNGFSGAPGVATDMQGQGMTNGRPSSGLPPEYSQYAVAQSGGGRATDPMYAGGSSTFNEQGGGQQQQQPMYGAQPNTNATANTLAQTGMHTNQWAPGWWNGLNPDQKQMTSDAWSMSGQSPATVLANASRNAITQGFGARAA